jgi:hypothetical protein
VSPSRDPFCRAVTRINLTCVVVQPLVSLHHVDLVVLPMSPSSRSPTNPQAGRCAPADRGIESSNVRQSMQTRLQSRHMTNIIVFAFSRSKRIKGSLSSTHYAIHRGNQNLSRSEVVSNWRSSLGARLGTSLVGCCMAQPGPFFALLHTHRGSCAQRWYRKCTTALTLNAPFFCF